MVARKSDRTTALSSLGARLRASDAFADVRDYIETGLRPRGDATENFVGLADPVPGDGEAAGAAGVVPEQPSRRRAGVVLASVLLVTVIGVATYAVIAGGWSGSWDRPDEGSGGAPPEYSHPSGEAPSAVPSVSGSRSPSHGGTPSGSPEPGSTPDTTSAPGAPGAPDAPPGSTPKPTRSTNRPPETPASPTAKPSKKPPRPKPTPSRRQALPPPGR